jgi:hypothetical protein
MRVFLSVLRFAMVLSKQLVIRPANPRLREEILELCVVDMLRMFQTTIPIEFNGCMSNS